jgi:hypothetical protein
MFLIMSNPVGRPSKYTPELQALADGYIYKLKELGHVVPSRAGLCCYLGITRETSYQWAKIHLKFSDTLQAIDVMQEHLALNGGLSSALNSTIVKLVLANHGYSDRQDINHESKGGTMSPTGKTLDDFYKDVPTKPIP